MRIRVLLPIVALSVFLGAAPVVQADNPTPYPGTVMLPSTHDYSSLAKRLNAAVKRNGMAVVARVSATSGAKSLGVTIPGNQIAMVYHPRFAVRMLDAYVPAGFEAPIRMYLTENADGTATLTYRTPSSVFVPYENEQINAMAAELDVIFETIAREAVAP